jgi:TPR repeat protein
MQPRLRLLTAALMLTAATATVTAVQQYLVPHMPPPKTSVWDFLDLGPAPAVPCSCVPNPFALPAQPVAGNGRGMAAPFDDPPMTEADRKINEAWYAQESANLQRMADDGVAGNGNASLSVAMHLSLHKTVFVVDENVEASVVRWLTLAAEQGHVDAYRLLGQRYAHGWGVKADYASAAHWFYQGALRGDHISMTAFGFLSAAGRGVPQDWEGAIRWWQRADPKSSLAVRFLGDAYACGAGVQENHERAAAAYRRGGEPSMDIQMGHMYLRGCARDEGKAAIAAFKRAADWGYAEAQIELSNLLREDRAVEDNSLQAYMWARLAERRLPPGDLKKRAAESAQAAARLWPAVVIEKEDLMINALLEMSKKARR